MKNRFASAVAAGTLLLCTGALALDAKEANDIMTKSACAACHTLDKKLVGPPYKEVAAKYRGNAKAAELMAQKVRAGGVGVWGQIPMPPNPKEKISDEDLKKLVGWLLAL